MATPPNPDDAPRRGRPTRLTPELAVGIAQAILDGMFRYAAGKLFNVTAHRFGRWMSQGRRFPDGVYGQFRTLILESEAEAERLCIKAVLAAGRDEDARHLEWWLERKFPQRWGRYRGELTQLRKEIADLRKLVTDATADRETQG